MGLFSRKNKTETQPASQPQPATGFSWRKIFSFKEFNEDFYMALEEKLIRADCGGRLSQDIINRLKEAAAAGKCKEKKEVLAALREILKSYFTEETLSISVDRLHVITVMGVNGVGKTTAIAKLAHFYRNQAGADVVLGAADTYRAAAREQLEAWGQRLGVQVIAQSQGSDAASVAYDTVHASLSRNAQLAIIDTAGRLHNKENLVAQLAKLSRVIDKFETQIVRSNILVLDATLGQSGLDQVTVFKDQIGVDGIILTKVDTQAKGGILLAVGEKLNVPVYFYSYGERLEDFSRFTVDQYLDAIIDA